jgi:lipoate-protein ligase A
MALDEAILQAVATHQQPPTLRLYRWTTPCLSLGYAQPAVEVEPDRLRAHAWELVRRMTVGRAILHTDEITYSVALPAEHKLATGTILDSYRRISKALLAAVQHIGVAASADTQPRLPGQPLSPVCFEVPSNYEIAVDGRKLLGSAQVRRHGGMVQHGSLPLTGDLTRICEALSFADEEQRAFARQRVAERATTLHQALGVLISWEQAAAAIMTAFAETFALKFNEAPASAEERRATDELRATRYAADAWTLRL